jgi:hypothetical protein
MAALVATAAAAIVGVWLTSARRRRSEDSDSTFVSRPMEEFHAPDIDDDTAAEIIRRARPSLEKARELSLQSR